MSGKFSWKSVAQGAAIGGMIGLTGGAVLAYGAAGTALASSGSVAAGLGYGYAATLGTAGVTGFEQARQLVQAPQTIQKVTPVIGNKLNYLFGQATGSYHNIKKLMRR